VKRRYVTLAATATAAVITSWIAIGPSGDPTVAAGTTPSISTASVGELLSKVTVINEVPRIPGYERGCGTDKKTQLKQGCVFGRAWNDPNDHSGCDTRNRILAAQLQDVKFKPGTRDCKVAAGWIDDPYTGVRIELRQVQLDHVFPLHRAWNSGAAQWDMERRIAFANDPANLLAVSNKANEAKGDSGIDNWLPSNPVERCPYVTRYLTVAAGYQLPITNNDRVTAITTCSKGR
jgi:hypothetical protein